MTLNSRKHLKLFNLLSVSLLAPALAIAACNSSPTTPDDSGDDDEGSGGRKASGGSKPESSGGKTGTSGGRSGSGGTSPEGGEGGQGGDPGAAGSPNGTGGSEPSADAVYVAQSLVFGDTGSTSYVALLPNLGTQGDVKLTSAREFAGYAPADVHDGKLMVGAGEAPVVTVFDIDDDLEWKQLNQVSFANYTTLPIAANISVDAKKAYSPIETVDFLTWDPIGGNIGKVISAHEDLLPNVGELKVIKGYASELRSGLLFQTYYFSDDTYNAFAELSQIAVVDTSADKALAVLDAPCPHLHVSSQDPKGNLYFSNGQGSIPGAVLNDEFPRNCFVRVPAGSNAIDEDSITYFKDIAEGREGSNFFHIDGDLALFNVYHAELDDITEDTTAEEVAYSPNYHIWTYNLKTGASAPMEDIGYTGGQFVGYRIDGKVYLTVPAADYSETAVYEISPQGKPTLRFSIQGWGFKLLKLR